jgi:hypothetical protein
LTKEELLAEAALILEQEGWLVRRHAYENPLTRMGRFAERYRVWQEKVKAFRVENPEAWPEPTDNS